MASLDWIVMGLFLLLRVGIGVWSSRQIKNTQDFFTAGGKMPWWLSGISHHMSGYSAAVFVAYAEVAYKYGFTIFMWWAVPIAISRFIGAIYIAPRWARMRTQMNIESPLEYLAIRYNIPTQQLMAWSGTVLKIFDVGAKWAAPLFYPDLADATKSYSKMAMEMLPPGIVGLVLASMFAHTMAMTTSDANAVTAVVTRDILPVIWKKFRTLSKEASLKAARLTTLTFMVLTWILAINASTFGGIVILLVLWFGAMVGPISIAMLLGLLPVFKHSGATAANVALIGGIAAFAFIKPSWKMAKERTSTRSRVRYKFFCRLFR